MHWQKSLDQVGLLLQHSRMHCCSQGIAPQPDISMLSSGRPLVDRAHHNEARECSPSLGVIARIKAFVSRDTGKSSSTKVSESWTLYSQQDMRINKVS